MARILYTAVAIFMLFGYAQPSIGQQADDDEARQAKSAPTTAPSKSDMQMEKGKSMSYGQDRDFLKEHVETIELRDPSGQAMVVVVPAYQGRVMTSTAGGAEGTSFGWINRELISSGKVQPHINAFGGEDRFWLGPEGGPYSIYFKQGAKQDFANWQTPAAIDTEPFETVRKADNEATFSRTVKLTNASGTPMDIRIDRTVRLVDPARALAQLGITQMPQGVKTVVYETENKITNTGEKPWTKDAGALSIWILGMYNPSEGTVVAVPFQKGPESELGPIVNDVYFGKVPSDRLRVDQEKGIMFFSGDGQMRSKIGVSPQRAKPVLGSYDANNGVLTLVWYNLPDNAKDMAYVNSVWGEQKDPYAGDVVNSYNDGPPSPGAKPMGPFYELETSSPAAMLEPGQSRTHIHRTIHIQGDEPMLDPIARKALGVGIADIKQGLGQQPEAQTAGQRQGPEQQQKQPPRDDR